MTLPIAESKPKRSMLPVLTVLFLISYGLMVLLVVEQNRTITSQRWLITEMMSDSKELSTLKGKIQAEQRNAKQHPHTKVQKQTPSVQAVPEAKTRIRRPLAEHPPRLASDAPDVRRALNKI